MTSQTAANRLENAFALRSTELPTDMIGIFGEGFPEALLRAAGARLTCLHVAPIDDDSNAGQAVSDCIEPFVDHAVQCFLHRFAMDSFRNLQAIIFCRDDTAALVAYQYASELRRLGLAPATPQLILWNLVHAPHAHDFNMLQMKKLWQYLDLAPPVDSALAATLTDERARANALAELSDGTGRIPASTAIKWRIAGRNMDGREHAQLISAALATAPRPVGQSLRLGLIGAPITAVDLYQTIEQHGHIVCDLQPIAAAWPVPLPEIPGIAAFLQAAASDPACARIVPPDRHTEMLLRRLTAANCDAVICQLQPHDDVFGWDVPQISDYLHANETPFINLGFIDPAPDDTELTRIGALLAHELRQRGLT
ncbi:2-hydroxyacyl-CoA dehydratase family protein [Roseinatronobacter alkalisoli]|uniref:2-hydroxyacyl-CoA dehydratase family protein n=1 Tax=Roseinatronobacter alkalisoli TaxID=3028235 RepID=A0ABT5TEV4_9RHOB|nr:2-hydroxyacyl-CoA dehydratase family protein [Roseinatronobacter sp. HJB301]MDD7972707.1 2-hydroxyacyl-CoA dehydratase family protein [Roseinatronobacter sp. HJB301]